MNTDHSQSDSDSPKAENHADSNPHAHVGRHSVLSFAAKIASVVVATALMVLLTRTMGKQLYGQYRLAFSWVTLLAVLATGGAGQLLIRQIPVFARQSDFARLKGIVRWSFLRTAIQGVLLAAAAMGVWAWYANFKQVEGNYWPLVCLAAAALPITGLLNLWQSEMRGLRRGDIAELPQLVIRPAVMLVVAISVIIFIGSWHLTAENVTAVHLLALVAAAVVAKKFLKANRPAELDAAQSRCDDKHSWRRDSAAMMLTSTMQIINTRADIILLGMLTGSGAAGVYAPAAQCAVFVGFVLKAVNAPLAATVSSLHSSGQREKLQKMLRHFAKISFIGSLMVALLLGIFSEFIMGVFGKDFTASAPALVILCGGQVVASLAGSVGVLLSMTGLHKYTAIYTFGGAVLNIILNIILIKPYGVTGAAIATAASMVLMNAAMCCTVIKKLKINPMAIGPAEIKDR